MEPEVPDFGLTLPLCDDFHVILQDPASSADDAEAIDEELLSNLFRDEEPLSNHMFSDPQHFEGCQEVSFDTHHNCKKGSEIRVDGKHVIFGLNWSFQVEDGKCKVPHNEAFLGHMTAYCENILASAKTPLANREFPDGGTDTFLEMFVNDEVTFWTRKKLPFEALDEKQQKKIASTGNGQCKDHIPHVTTTSWTAKYFVAAQSHAERKELLRKVLSGTVFHRVKGEGVKSTAGVDCSAPLSETNPPLDKGRTTADSRKRRAIECPPEETVRMKRPGESLLYSWMDGDTLDLDSFVDGLLVATAEPGMIIEINDRVLDDSGYMKAQGSPTIMIPRNDDVHRGALSYTMRTGDHATSLAVAFRKLKGYTAHQLRTAIEKANPHMEGTFDAGATIIVPEMKLKKDGALFHLQCRRGDSYLLLAENILAASSSVSAEVIRESNPRLEAGKSVEVPVPSRDQEREKVERTLYLAVCDDDDCYDTLASSLARFQGLSVERIAQQLINSNPYLKPRRLIAGDLFTVRDPAVFEGQMALHMDLQRYTGEEFA